MNGLAFAGLSFFLKNNIELLSYKIALWGINQILA